MKLMRDNIEDKYCIAELQEKILEIAAYIDRFCSEHNIEYCLMGGSALGAVRHKGFIPWDDDLDIFMTADNYEKFRNAFEGFGDKENFYLQQLMHRSGLVASAKLRMNNTSYIEEATQDWKIHQGIFVDIFILHNCPKNKVGQMLQCLAAKYVLTKGQSFKECNYSGIRKLAIGMVRMLPRDFGVKFCLKRLYKYDKKETPYVCHFMGKAFFTEGIYNAKYFVKTQKMPFETVDLSVPYDVHEYLKGRFGDYMKLPSEESIKLAQHALKWDTEKDFSKYKNRERDFSDEVKLV